MHWPWRAGGKARCNGRYPMCCGRNGLRRVRLSMTHCGRKPDGNPAAQQSSEVCYALGGGGRAQGD